MSLEVREVPANWEHPRDEDGAYKPLLSAHSFNDHMQDWSYAKLTAESEGQNIAPEEFETTRPDRDKDFMPEWTDGEATHYQMYETTSEGTPISPVMETPEMLASWLVENNVSAAGGQEASYEGWLKVCRGVEGPEQDKTSLKDDYMDELYYRLQMREDAEAEHAHEQDNGRDRD